MERQTVEIYFLKYKSPDIETRCLESIFHNTHWPYHLHVIDWREGTKSMSAAWNSILNQHGHYYYKMFIDSDTVVADGWLNYMMLAMERNKNAGVIVPRTDNCGEARQIRLTANDPITELPLASGFCFLFHMSAYLDCGKFDTRFAFYGQDSEWFIRLIYKTKWKIYCEPKAFVHHEASYSVRNAENDGYDFKKDKENALRLFWECAKEYGSKL